MRAEASGVAIGERRRRAGVAAAAIALVALLGACGSSTGSSAATATTATTAAPTTTTATTPPGAAADATVDGTQIDRLPQVPAASTTPARPDLSTVAGQETFLRGVFADIQAMWDKDFAAAGIAYAPARLVLFRSRVSTACGDESAQTGPFYCSGDRAVYLDVSFFTALEAQFGVSGDFAEAYVVAHEVGHHIQNLLGVTGRVAAADAASPATTNARSVSVELQADCFAGVWAHSTYERDLLEPGDVDEALRAAQVVGDDFLAHASGAAVDPDSWTHGSSAQRERWFTTGYESGDPDSCDTFTGG